MISWRARFLNAMLRLTYKPRLERIQAVTPAAVERSRRRLARMERWMASLPRDVTIQPVRAPNVRGEWVAAANAQCNHVFLYLHGGAYALGSARLYRDLAWRLSAAARTRILVMDYGLAPEHPFPAAVQDAQAAWHWLLSRGVPPGAIVIGGDSAGGGLGPAALLALRDAGQPPPAAGILLSPWTDLTVSGDSVATSAQRDPFLVSRLLPEVARLYLQEADARNPLASPVFGDLAGLPPLLMHVGSTEILLSDSTRFAKKAQAAGVDVTLRVWERMPHIFHLFGRYLPEGRQVIYESGEFARAHFRVA